jgi:transketolase
VICITGDGEHNEGQVWEAIMLASKYKLNQLTVLVDRNNIQIDGFTEDVMPLSSLSAKYEAFGFHVIEIDGHNFASIMEAFGEADSVFERPTCIIARTIPGKGVEFMERDFHWHGVPPNKDQAREALADLRTLKGKILSEHE